MLTRQHLLIEFFLGVYDWLHIPIPIWIQVEGVTGVVRLRVQFIVSDCSWKPF